MAHLYQATITPTKLEMLAAWAPHRPWYAGSGTPTVLGAYRFDDPAGEVGIETFLVQAGDGPVLHVPVTYRGAPLAGAEDALVTEMQHSVLGPRWVYDGCADPAYAAALATTILRGGREATMQVEVDGELTTRETTTFVNGSGLAGAPVPEITTVERHEVPGCTVIEAGGLELTVCRVVSPPSTLDTTGTRTLVGRWPNNSTPTLLALAR
ncbi:hypothetical protein [Nocardioides sp.]|uniref:CG0192-related protein n=1 Tax=Nocardioides sp. TaxID=35761 RepID=UPI00271DD3B3|nr:hypothetical protein [Nocardioides sp.]MDO9456249.1 hypothetical protein [Nocardioides sp.]